MRRLLILSVLIFLVAGTQVASGASGRVVKVLPHFIDSQGRHTLSPSLFERDAYQAFLRQNPQERSGIRFDVQWKTRGAAFAPLKVRVELRGIAEGNLPRQTVLEKQVTPRGWFGHWVSLPLAGEEYKKFGDVTAWRVTLWEGRQLLGEQKSFLW
jgi:hypothetical protein